MNQKSMPTSHPGRFKSLIGTSPHMKIVDIGASSLDGDVAPYAALIAAGDAELIAFEPHPRAHAKLMQTKQSNETFLAQVVGDGRRQTLRFCYASGMSSLLSPNSDVLNLFHLFPEHGQVVSAIEVNTVRLDDVIETAGADLIKIDIQGAELMVFANAPRRLLDVSVIHTEVLFLPMYEGQPLFSEVELFLRSKGFMIHCLQPAQTRMISPFIIDGDAYGGLNQIVWADAIFIRDLTRLDLYSDHQLVVTAHLVHDMYKSFDVSSALLTEYDRRRSAGLSKKYLSALKTSYPGLILGPHPSHS